MDQDQTIYFAGKVMMVYEDLRAGLRGKKFIDTLESQLQLASGVSVSWWRWDTLREPCFREQAAVEARDADVIIVSARGKTALPEEVQDWLARWLDEKQERWYAIEILLDSHPATTNGDNDPAIIWLSKIAKEAHADLFANFPNYIGGEIETIGRSTPFQQASELAMPVPRLEQADFKLRCQEQSHHGCDF